MKKLFAQFLRNESGATMVEYGLILGLVSVVAIATLTSIGTNLVALFSAANTALTAAS